MQKNLKRLTIARNTLLTIFLLLLGFSFVKAQTINSELDVSIAGAPQRIKEESEAADSADSADIEAPDDLKPENSSDALKLLIEYQPDKSLSEPARIGYETGIKEKTAKFFNDYSVKEADDQTETERRDKFHWKPALLQSGVFLGIQHAFRMTQHKTRRELDGKFFPDWAKSVKNLRGWDDQDNLFTNYVAHPLQGGLTGRIFVNNSDRAARQEFGASKKYWESRLKAMAWSAVWSTQFELGPISEASIGNVGIRDKRGGPTMTWGDLVITPTLGTGVLVIEDAIDKYVLKNWLEKKIENKLMLKMFRIVLTPTTSVANLLRVKKPSWRAGRPL